MLALAGCSIDGLVIWSGPGLGDDESSEGDSDDGDDGIEGNDDDSGLLDLPEGEGEQRSACVVAKGQLDAALPCNAAPTSTTLAPVVAWTWTGPSLEDSVIVTPLVANLDDDNADGLVDLCDVPDLVVVAVDLPASKNGPIPAGHIYVIDTETGETKLRFAHAVDATATPALADLDDDGVPEILAFERSHDDLGDDLGELHERRVIAFDAAGSVRWTSDTWVSSYGGGALAVADLDADGSPEILAPEHVLSADGELLWAPPDPPTADSLPVAADLDLDGELEVLFGRSVYAHDGQLLFDLELPGNLNAGISAVANFDDDPEPEIYVHSVNHRIFEHDGTLKATCGGGNSSKHNPATIADIDGDGKAEILVNHGARFRVSTVVDDSCEPLWEIKISDGVGSAFDFLADGSAEAIYADLDWVRIFADAQDDDDDDDDDDGDDDGPELVFEYERKARPSMANPVVADADNDGAAELIIVASEPVGGDDGSARPSVIYIQNADDQFAPTRRIWNQHTYYATNVREDARVPVEQQDDWREGPNSFRANPDPSYDGQQCQQPVVP